MEINARQWGTALALFVSLALFLYLPTLGCLGDCVVDLEQVHDARMGRFAVVDVRLNAWILAWTQRALVSRPLSLFAANALYPDPQSLAGSEHMVGLALTMLPFRFLTQDAIAIYQLSIIVSAILLALTTWVWVRELTGSHSAGLVAGAIAMFMPWRLTELSHVQLLAAHWFPLIWMLVHRMLTTEVRCRELVLLTLVAGLQLLTSFYLAYLLTLSVGILVLGHFVYGSVRSNRFGRLILSLVPAYAALALTSIPYIGREARGELIQEGMPVLAPEVIGMTDLLRFGNYLAPRFEATWAQVAGPPDYHIPVIAFILSLITLVSRWRPRTSDTSHDTGSALVVKALWTIVVVSILFAVGSRFQIGESVIELPGAWAARLVPGLEMFRAPHRWAILVGLVVPVLAGIGFSRIVRLAGGDRKALWVTATVVVLLMPWRSLPAASIWDDALRSDEAYAALNELEDGAVLELPWHTQTLARTLVDSHYLLASTSHWKPILNGVTGYPPPSYYLLNRLAADLPDSRAAVLIDELAGPRWFVVHIDGAPEREKLWLDAAGRSGMRVAYRGPKAIVFEAVPRETTGSMRARLLDPAPRGETLGGVKRVVPADGGRGHLSLVTLPSFRSGLAAVLEITAQNRGESAWPGLDWQSEGIVRVRYAFSDDSGGVVASGTDPLYRDIPPGSRANLRVVLRPPDHPGRYELRVDLVQEFASREEITSLDVEPMQLSVDVN